MKKKVKISNRPITGDIKLIINENSGFFDKLVELIPARFYLPVEDKKPWFQGLSKVAKASAKKESRENIKKARRERLDPEKPSGTLDLLKKNIEEENDDDDDDDDDDDEEEDVKFENPIQTEEKEESLTYEELRQKFHKKLEELRSNRKAGPSEESNREKKRQMNKGNRKRDNESEVNKQEMSKEVKAAKDIARVSEELTFGHVKIDDKDDAGRKRRKLSKAQALEEAKKLQEAKNDPEKGEIIAKKHSWNAATSRAAGIKVHDNPRLIKESIKKEKKKHQKNVGKWKERIDSRDKVRADKQKTRSENIAGRIHQKKMRKIEKREKKLMRPGFEGRKQGFINESST